MKFLRRVFCILVSIFSGIHACYSQAKALQHKSIISSKIVVLIYKHNDSSSMEDHTDTLNIPVVSDKYPALKEALSEKKILFGDDLKTVKQNYAGCSCGIVGLNFEVTFENKDVISLKLNYDTEAAYPDTYQQWLTLNIQTGKPRALSAEINEQGRNWLLKMYKDTLLKRIKDDKAATPEEDTATYNQLKTNILGLKGTELFSKYIFTNTGIIISIDPVLPHVIRGQEPDDDLFIPYRKLKPYISPQSIILKQQIVN